MTLGFLMINKIYRKEVMKDICMIDDRCNIAPTLLVIQYDDPPKVIVTLEIFIPKMLVIRGLATFPYNSN